ncbi:TIGR03985 family CRISPR-associated protein [Leptolyngbya sp. FACHB-711]|uniref:TIGR03985 family CRISPR-associated protein n=1 Tax=Leptolyngbya sp. FACHB-711 TaxID=2692813 RepID=UPI0016895355|nr:TIGR03985 family CRISPR-associated protein [Leptolyngbya sp. FACHB-711]MBD2023918.1 TIGR03985 family CRISPR-associated protein [Leptolyngbya sp. FACHB-711]
MSNTIVHADTGDRFPVLNELRPDLELLRWLARGSLKQNLLRAIRLWVWLRWLYGDDQTLSDPFTFADCRGLFFSASHPKGEQAPDLHDPKCPCARTAAQWLFNAQMGLSEREWRQDLQQYEAISKPDLNQLLNSRLFAVTRRSLTADLQELAKLGWLHYLERDRHYRRVTQFPAYPGAKQLAKLSTVQAIDPLELFQPDLGTIVQNHAGNVRGIQRFFLHLDYITPFHKLDQVDDWQEELRQVWQQDPVPPLQLTYQSARHQTTLTPIVYPVCIYYAQRSVYLCGFSPELSHQWYNFRLDRIQHCCSLDWTDAAIPAALRLFYQKGQLPDPSYIQIELDKAWGFDFYLQPQQMVLRFNRDFHDRYIVDTFRHSTFKAIDRSRVMQLMRQHKDGVQRETMLQVLQMRSLKDAYYQVCYRDGDTNIRHRLRAWRPHVEVLLPWSLRQEIAEEVQAEFQFYHGESYDSYSTN